MRAIVVALEGPSASGKTTVSSVLARRYRWARIDEAFDRLRPRPGLRFGSQAELAALELRLLDEEARRFRDAQTLALRGRVVVADTSFLDPVTYTVGLLLLGLATPATFRTVVRHARSLARQGRLGLPDLTIRLAVSAAIRRDRAAGSPARHPRAFRARHEAVGQVEEAFLVPWWAARSPGRVRVVRAGAPASPTAERVRRAAGRTTPVRDPCHAAARVLDELARLPAVRPVLRGRVNLKRTTQPPRRPR